MRKSGLRQHRVPLPSPGLRAVLSVLITGAFLLIQARIGGTRPNYCLPAYGFLAIAAVLSLFHRPEPWRKSDAPVALSAALLFGWITIRAAFSPLPFLAWNDAWMVLACYLVYLLFTQHLTAPAPRAWVLGALTLAAMVHVLVGIAQFKSGDDFMLFGMTRPPTGHRASGLFISPNHYAGFLEVVGVMLLSFACWSRWQGWLRAGAGYAALLCYLGVAVSGSRGGYLSVAFSLLFFGLVSVAVVGALDRRRAYRFLLIGAIVLGLAGFGAVQLMQQNPLLKTRLDLLTEQYSGGRLDDRIYNWAAALDQFGLSPWIGTGSGTHLYYGRSFRRPEIQADPIHAHSDYLELLAEYGIVGGVVMGIFLLTHLRRGFKALAAVVEKDILTDGVARNDAAATLIAALSAVAAYVAHSAVDFNLHIPANALLFAAIFGVLAHPSTQAPVSIPQMRAGIWPRLALPALGIWMLAIVASKLPGEYWTDKARQSLVPSQTKPGNYGQTIEFAKKAIAQDKGNPAPYLYLGQANRLLGDEIPFRMNRAPYYEAAVTAYRQELALFPEDEYGWGHLGEALDGLKRFSEAETAYLTAINLDPSLGVPYELYAKHLERRGRTAAAQFVMRWLESVLRHEKAPIPETAPDASKNPVRQ
jgi:O-antigen ligase